MRRVMLILVSALVFVSCKENSINGFSSVSVKNELSAALNQSEWVTDSKYGYYSKIFFDNQIIELTDVNGGVQRVGFDVTNVTSPILTLPDTIQIRLKSGRHVDELKITKEYNYLRSVVTPHSTDTMAYISTYSKK